MCNHVDLLTQSTCLKAKISQSTHNENIKLLTLVPRICSLVVKEYGVSHDLARKARNLKKTKVYSQILKKKKLGHGLSSDEVKLIEYFYHDDEFSRQCPGNLLLFELTKGKLKKNTQTNNNNMNFKLVNLNVLYVEFKIWHKNFKSWSL